MAGKEVKEEMWMKMTDDEHIRVHCMRQNVICGKHYAMVIFARVLFLQYMRCSENARN